MGRGSRRSPDGLRDADRADRQTVYGTRIAQIARRFTGRGSRRSQDVYETRIAQIADVHGTRIAQIADVHGTRIAQIADGLRDADRADLKTVYGTRIAQISRRLRDADRADRRRSRDADRADLKTVYGTRIAQISRWFTGRGSRRSHTFTGRIAPIARRLRDADFADHKHTQYARRVCDSDKRNNTDRMRQPSRRRGSRFVREPDPYCRRPRFSLARNDPRDPRPVVACNKPRIGIRDL
jgi:hypothetical protein